MGATGNGLVKVASRHSSSIANMNLFFWWKLLVLEKNEAKQFLESEREKYLKKRKVRKEVGSL